MKRRNFIELLTIGGGAAVSGVGLGFTPATEVIHDKTRADIFSADVVIAGGGLGGCAAALAALRNNLKVILTEETDWIGGQLTQQGVPPDEHGSIETAGAPQSYRDLRNKIRSYYIQNYPLTDEAKVRKNLNPGDGGVSRLCHEPKVALAVLNEMLAPYISSGRLSLLTEHRVTSADVSGNQVKRIKAVDLKNGIELMLTAPYFVDATELGDLLPLTGTEFVTGTESKSQTGELHAPEKANEQGTQSFTACFAIDYVPGENHLIPRPKNYDFWVNHVPQLNPPWPGKLLALHYSSPVSLAPTQLGFDPTGKKIPGVLNLWLYRRIINMQNFVPGSYRGDITVVNWPQNDYMLGNLIGASDREFKKQFEAAKQLSLSLLYWLQTEAPRADGGKGWPGIRLRKDIMGTADGLAKYPYVRESRRIKAVFTILEEHVGKENRALVTGKKEGNAAAEFYDSVGIGAYGLDLHPTCSGDNYHHLACFPFQIPLGALLPVRMENLIPANKNIGTTHITNGCYRLHPVEWSIGEAVGSLIAFALSKKISPHKVREQKELLTEFQHMLRSQGIETEWKKK